MSSSTSLGAGPSTPLGTGLNQPRPTPDATDGRRRTRLARWCAVGLVLSIVLVYAPVRQHEFVNLDDPQYVSENRHVSSGLTWEGLSWAFTAGHAGNWHPVTWLSHMLDVEMYGLRPGPHHVTNVLWHIANTLLLFTVFHRMTAAPGRSAFVAALFALHPLHVESVAWVAERKDVLSTFFWFLTLWAYLEYVRRPRRVRYSAVMACFALGLMAKPMLVTLPIVLLLLDYWPLRRRAVLEKIPLFMLAAASSVVTLLVQQQGGAVKALEHLPLARRLANAVVAYVTYVGQMVWPARLAVIYPYPAIDAWWWPAGAIALVVVSVVAVRAARSWPYVPVGWFWFLATLVPVIGLVQVGSQPMADRYTYVPLVGLFIIAAWGGADLFTVWAGARRLVPLAAVVVLVAAGVAARAQVQHWKSSISLWEHALEVTHDNYRAHAGLAHAFATQRRVADSVPHYVEALRIHPEGAEAHNNLGVALTNLGKPEEALAAYAEAVRLQPRYFEARNNLGASLATIGRLDEAIEQFSEAVRLNPQSADVHNYLGDALSRRGRQAEAVDHFSHALRLSPGNPRTHHALAIALAEQGKIDEAMREAETAIRLEPGQADSHFLLASLYARKGRHADALEQVVLTAKLDPTHEGARRALADLQRGGAVPKREQP